MPAARASRGLPALSRATLLLAALLLAACGGGGGGGAPPTAPQRPVPPPPEPEPVVVPEPVEATAPALAIPLEADPANPTPDVAFAPVMHLATDPLPIPANRNSAAFQRIRLGDAYARSIDNIRLNGTGITIGIMEEVNHFHPELAANIDMENSIFAPAYDGPKPDEKYIIPAADFARYRYPNQACYLAYDTDGNSYEDDCPDTSGASKYFLRMEDDSLRLLPGVKDKKISIDGKDEPQDSEFGNTHGTGVASLAAADMDEAGHDTHDIYGVASEAKILVYARPVRIAGLESKPSEHADYFKNAPDAADVYNFSHVYDMRINNANTDPQPDFSKTIADAIEEKGKVIIAPAGNENGHKFPQFPAALPLFYPNLRGQMIAVAAVGANGRIAQYSNHCGALPTNSLPTNWNAPKDGVHYCLAAPGSGLRLATEWDGTTPKYNNDNRQGTSFAAPMVTGAFALLKQFFRSSITDRELVLRLLHTANRGKKDNNDDSDYEDKDEFDYSDHTIYGAGLLDLEAATRPVGTPDMQTGDMLGEASHVLAATSLALSPAFGDGLALALGQAQIAVFDRLGAPFWRPLAAMVSTQTPRTGLARRIAGLHAEANRFATPGGGEISLSAAEAAPRGKGYGLPAFDDDQPLRLSLRQPVAAGAEILLAAGDLNAFADHLQPADWPAAENFAHPYLGLAGEGAGNFRAGLGAGLPLAGGRLTALGFAAGGPPSQHGATESARRESAAHGGLLHYGFATAAGMELGLQAGGLLEQARSLGLQSTGGFGALGDSSTAFAAVSLAGHLPDKRWRWQAQAFGGLTRTPSPAGGLIARWPQIATSAFQMRLAGENVLHENSRLVLSLQQPLRVESGTAQLSIVSGRTPEGAIVRSPAHAELQPSGRELELAVRHETALNEDIDAILGAGLVREAGHAAGRKREFYALAGLRLAF